MNFFKKLLLKIQNPKQIVNFDGKEKTIELENVTIDSSGTHISGTVNLTGANFGSNAYNTTISSFNTSTIPVGSIISNSSLAVTIGSDSSRISVSLDDLIQYGRQGYLVKIMNLSVEDRKWLRDQLDTDSVNIA